MHGHGIYLYADGIRYDGDYQNDKPHGEKAKLFYNNKQLMYNGSMVEGKKEGNGIFYYPNGQIMFDGVWDNDEPSGLNKKIYNENVVQQKKENV